MSDFINVREPHTDKLLFRFDPQRDIIEIQRRGVKTVVDLTQYKSDKERQQSGIDNNKAENINI